MISLICWEIIFVCNNSTVRVIKCIDIKISKYQNLIKLGRCAMNRKNIAVKNIIASTIVSLAISASLLLAASMFAYRTPDPDAVASPIGISTLVTSFALCGVVSGLICHNKIDVALSCILFAAPQATLSLTLGDGKPITIMASSAVSFAIGWLIIGRQSNRGHARHTKRYYKGKY